MRRRTQKRNWLVLGAVAFLFAANAQQPSHGQAAPGAEDRIPHQHSDDAGIAEPQALLEAHQYAEAAGKIRAYLKLHPDSAAAHFLLGYTLYRQDSPRESLAEYTSGARYANPGANDLAVVAMDYILLHDYADADRWLTRATTLSADNDLYWYYLGRVKYLENQFAESIRMFQRCLALAPRNLPAEYNLGLAYEGAGRDEDAKAAYQTAIAWQQSSGVRDPQPYLDFGIMLLDQGKPEDALPLLQKAVALGPQNPRAHEQLGKAWKELHKLGEADAEMQTAVRLAPDISALHYEMGRIFQLEGQAAKAREEFQRCSALDASQSTDSSKTPNLPPTN